MEYRQLGKSGLKLSEIGFGAWLTFGKELGLAEVKACLYQAFDLGINFFDNAEAYGNGMAELLMGEALKAFPRQDIVISTKIYWGGKGPNRIGHSWKRLVEGTKDSLRRLQLDHVDLLFCHRKDPHTSIEETVRAMDTLIRSGLVFYWGTSEWPAADVKRAYEIAEELHAIPPTMEQPEYNLFVRDNVERELAPLCDAYGLGTTIWSPLASGILSGKYIDGIPANSRLAMHPELRAQLNAQNMVKVKKMKTIADALGCTPAQLAIAWCLKNPHVSSVITGATTLDQLQENVAASEIQKALTPQIMQDLNTLFPLT